MRLALNATLLVLALTGCFADPACQDECDGDAIARCRWDCPDSRDVTRMGDCERVTSRVECGAGLTCVRALASNSPEGDSGAPTCVDAPLVACDPEDARPVCSAPHRVQSCRITTDGAVLTTTHDDFCLDQPGTECHTLQQGVTCVRTPKQGCSPGTSPVCLADGVTLERCDGREGDYAVVEIRCGAGCVPGEAGCSAP